MRIFGISLTTIAILAGGLNGTWGSEYSHVPNAAITGYNKIQLSSVSVQDCMNACDRESWCKSFDYYKGQQKCDLSDKNASDIGELKTDYDGNPYDHYSKDNNPSNGSGEDRNARTGDDDSRTQQGDTASSTAAKIDDILDSADDQRLAACLQSAYQALLLTGLKVIYRRESTVYAHNTDFRARVRCPEADDAIATTGVTVISRGDRDPIALRDAIVGAIR